MTFVMSLPASPGNSNNMSEILTGQNVGTGAYVFKNKVSPYLNFRSLKAGANVTITQSDDEILIDANPASTIPTGVLGKYLRWNGSALIWQNGLAVLKKLDGTDRYFDTIATAKAAAVSGETIILYGVHTDPEKLNLNAGGAVINYFLMPGTVLNYSSDYAILIAGGTNETVNVAGFGKINGAISQSNGTINIVCDELTWTGTDYIFQGGTSIIDCKKIALVSGKIQVQGASQHDFYAKQIAITGTPGFASISVGTGAKAGFYNSQISLVTAIEFVNLTAGCDVVFENCKITTTQIAQQLETNSVEALRGKARFSKCKIRSTGAGSACFSFSLTDASGFTVILDRTDVQTDKTNLFQTTSTGLTFLVIPTCISNVDGDYSNSVSLPLGTIANNGLIVYSAFTV